MSVKVEWDKYLSFIFGQYKTQKAQKEKRLGEGEQPH